jgi:hypothetical protein
MRKLSEMLMENSTNMTSGANWIHGIQNNPIADIARRTKTITHGLEEGQAIIDSKGRRLDDRTAGEISEAVWAIVVEAFQYSDEHSADIDKSKSLMDYFREQVPKREPDASKQALMLEEAYMWGTFVGDSIERQSLKFFFLEECIDGGEYVSSIQMCFTNNAEKTSSSPAHTRRSLKRSARRP